MGAGIVDAEALVRSDPAPAPSDAVTADAATDDTGLPRLLDTVARGVAGVKVGDVSEGDGGEAATAPIQGIDLKRYGRELSHILLDARFRGRAAAAAPGADAAAGASVGRKVLVSEALKQAATTSGDVRLVGIVAE
jgi:hypothetical protein